MQYRNAIIAIVSGFLFPFLLIGCISRDQLTSSPTTQQQKELTVDTVHVASEILHDDNSDVINSLEVVCNEEKHELTITNNEIPVIEVLSACGVSIDWDSPTTGFFELDSIAYRIDITNMEIRNESNLMNVVEVPPGTIDGFVRQTGQEIYVDVSTMNGILHLLGISASVYK